MARIAVILPYDTPMLRELFVDIAQSLKVELVFAHAYLGEAYPVIQRLRREMHLDAVIARNVTASMIRQRFELPVVDLELTSFDLLRGCHKLAGKCRRIGYFQFSEVPMYFDAKSIESILTIPIESIEVSREDTNIDYLELLEERGCDGLATSSHVIYSHCADKIEAVHLEISREEITSALTRALNTIDVCSRDLIRTEFLRSVLNSLGDGFVATDAKGYIILINSAMEAILCENSASLIGLPKAAALAKHPFLQEVFQAEDGAIITHQQLQYTVNHREKVSGAFSMSEIISVASVSGIQRLERNLRRKLAERGFEAKYTFGSIIGKSEAMEALKQKAAGYAASKSNILIVGESGTGKEMFAQSIHNASACQNGPFVAINCAALPDNLLESELFGYEEGAFTGARKGGKPGLMEMAHGGTLFLDEISELSVALQAKLLRSLQERQIGRIGGDKLIPIDCRFVFATNRNLRSWIDQGRFREDLFYRINVLLLTLPPLKERGEDIMQIAYHMLSRKNEEIGKTVTLDEEMARWLMSYHWPGNIRELENLVERLIVMTGDGEIPWDIFSALIGELTGRTEAVPTLLEGELLLLRCGTMEEIEQQVLEETARRKGGHIGEICEELGISRTTYWRKTHQTTDKILPAGPE